MRDENENIDNFVAVDRLHLMIIKEIKIKFIWFDVSCAKCVVVAEKKKASH